MNKQQARRIAREVTGVLIQRYVEIGGIRQLHEVKTQEDLERMEEAFAYLRSIVEQPRNAADHPSRGLATQRAINKHS